MRALILFAGLALPAFGGVLEPLEEAGQEVARKCKIVGTESLADCGNIQGRGAAESAARKAVAHALTMRAIYVDRCEKRAPLAVCTQEADWFLQSGLTSAPDALPGR